MGESEKRSRRDFLRNAGRLAVCGGLVGIGARLLYRAGRPQSSEVCANSFICRGCERVTACGLPQALSYKSAGRQSDRRKED